MGKIPVNHTDFKKGSTRICRYFNFEKGCSRALTNNCCKNGEITYQHVCAIILAINGSELRLCGKNHSATKHN